MVWHGIVNDEQLENKIYHDFMKPLTAKARPLFYFNNAVWNEKQSEKLAFLAVPASSAPIQAAAMRMHDVGFWEITTNTTKDCISAMTIMSGFPICAEASIQKYREEYEKRYLPAGLYSYEGKNVPGMTFNDWSKLPPLCL